MTTRRSNKTRRGMDAGRSVRAVILALCTSFAAIGCDSITGTDSDGPVMISADVTRSGTIVVTFDQELDRSTVDGSRFRVSASLANGRGANFGSAERATYNGDGSVELQMRNPIDAPGRYSVRANDIRNPSGVITTESSAQFAVR